MKLITCLLFMGLTMSGPLSAAKKDGEKEALLAKQNESSSLYGEKYQFVTFDGRWKDNTMQDIVRYAGNNDRTYSAWVNCYGDVVVGYYDNKTKQKSENLIIDNQKIKIENSALSLSVSPNGVLQLAIYGADKNNVQLFTSKPENINSWTKSTLAVKYSVNDMVSLCNGNDNYLGVYGNGTFSLFINRNGKFQEIAKIDDSNKLSLLKMQNIDGNIYVLISDRIYSVKGNTFKEISSDFDINKKIPATAKLNDWAITAKGFVKVYSDNSGFIIEKKDGKKSSLKNIKVEGAFGKAVIDNDTPDNFYFTRKVKGVDEIYVVNKKNKITPVTENSPFDNHNIVCVTNAPADVPYQMSWIQETLNDVKVNRLASVRMNVQFDNITDCYNKEQIKELMKRVADWQLGRSYIEKKKNDWHWGAFYEGLMATYGATKEKRYWDEMMNVGQFFNWGLLKDVMHADRLLICDMYEYLYEKSGKKSPEMLVPTKIVMDLHSSRKAKVNPHFNATSTNMEWWTWCDALFMAPASFFNYSRITGDKAPMDFANKQWLEIEKYLYSKPDSLFYRDDRYFDKKTTNGKKVFWSRGNGWVMGAMPRIMNALPVGHPYRKHYEDLFKTMASRIKRLQLKDGMWTCSLLDPQELPHGESSGSGFFGFALCWGVNNGLLDKAEYNDAIMKAWKSMSGNVSLFGRLGYVQQVAGEPYPFYYNQYHTYASGAYLLFGNEMLKYLSK